MPSLAPVLRFSIALVVLLAACSTRPGSDPPSRSQPTLAAPRDIDTLERLKVKPQECDADKDCPSGSRCDDAAGRCTWDCLSDSDCNLGLSCTVLGACELVLHAYIANDTPGCALVPPADRRAALLHLADDTDDDDPPSCFDDSICPCGSYCSDDAVCRVDCLSDNPTPDLTCPAGKACTPLGRCEAAVSTPPPPIQLSLEISPEVVTGDTAPAAVVVPVTLRTRMNAAADLAATNPAIVKYRIAESVHPVDGEVYPRVKCAASAELSPSCELDGGWTFDVTSGSLESAPRTIWVELPNSAVAKSWTLESRSEWAELPATALLQAAPVLNPSTDPGHYTGTLSWPNGGAAATDAPLSVPIEAIATPTDLVVIEPSRLIFPDGHAVLPRDAANTVLLGWLATDSTATSPRLDVRLDLGPLAYTQANGSLEGAITLYTGTTATPLTLSLTRNGDVPATCGGAAPACATGTYCDATVDVCVPGTGPASGAGIMLKTSPAAVPSHQLPSAQVAAWAGPLTALVAANPAQLSGSPFEKLERAYCHREGQTGAARLGASPTLYEPALDQSCTDAAGAENAQPTFELANRTTEVDVDDGGTETFSLLKACLADLGVQPTGAATTANLIPWVPCASLGRFFLAMQASSGNAQPLVGQRRVVQLLRQWLGVNAFVASSSVQNRQYQDVIASDGPAAQDRLGSALDLVEQNFRVLLDPTVRPQFATQGTTVDADMATVAVAPDYRLFPRPVAHWTFNEGASPFPNTESNNGFFASNSIYTSTQDLYEINNTTGVCSSQGPVALDDQHFSIVFSTSFDTVGAFIPFKKVGPDGHSIWIEATINNSVLSLVLRDSEDEAFYFTDIPAASTFGQPPNFGLLAVVANAGTYTVYQYTVDGQIVTYHDVDNEMGNPHWGSAGLVQLACNLPQAPALNVCKSWDLNTVGDGGDVGFQGDFNEVLSGGSQVCTRTCTPGHGCSNPCSGGQPGPVCNAVAGNRRAALVQGMLANPPAAALAPFTVTAFPINLATVTETIDAGVTRTTTTWQCEDTVSHYPFPGTRAKPVCGRADSLPYAPSGVAYDELSLWSRALTADDVAALGARYAHTNGNSSLPPIDVLPLPGQEQATGLASHIIEAASADLDLALAYAEAERSVMYEECYLGGPSPTRDRALERTGRNLRTVAVLEGEAERLAGLPGVSAAPWFARYQSARLALAGKRGKVLDSLRRATQCENPLGIGENDLPLFNGNNGTAAVDKFFGSSRFLTGRAKDLLTAASTELATARTKYIEERQSAFQVTLAALDKTQAINNLKVSYEAVLRRFCGAPTGTQTLLDGFIAGTLTASNCAIKTEVPACAAQINAPLSSISPSCLRGEIGEHLLQIQSAGVDVANAAATAARALEQYDADQGYCARRQLFLDESSTILAAHNTHMQQLRASQATRNNFTGLVEGITHFSPSTFMSGLTGILHSVGLPVDNWSNALQEQKDAEDYQAVVDARSHQLDIAACYHQADNDKFAIDAARDTMKRVAVETQTSLFDLDNAQTTVAAVANEAAGQLALEASLDRTPPHFHFWLADEITAYQRDFSYARRLTYLALRSFEYESQQSIGLRSEVLTARDPNALLAVVQAIEQRNAPMQGEQGFVVGQPPPMVLSLRAEILHLDEFLATPPLPGAPVIPPGGLATSSQKALQDMLLSDATKIYDKNNVLLGHGIRFSLKPGPLTQTSCAERISLVAAALQLEGTWDTAQPNLVLIQDNAFGSQQCRAAQSTVDIAHVEPAHNLLVDDGSVVFSDSRPSTPMNVSAQIGKSRIDLGNMTTGLSEGFSGRGLYANYILLFPNEVFTDAVLAQVKDVLLRFDIVEVTNVSL